MSRRNWGIAIVLLAAGVASAELTPWVRFVDAAGNLEGVFFKRLNVPGGDVAWRRAPAEARAELTKVIAAQPARVELYSLRALEAERQLDFTAAETDWTKFVELSQDKTAAWTSKADYHHRRLEPTKELQALAAAGLFARAVQLAQDQALGPDVISAQYQSWLARTPQDAQVYLAYSEVLLRQKRWPQFQTLTDAFIKAFPSDEAGALRMRARLEQFRTSAASALAIYDKAFRPDWDQSLVRDYFNLVKQTKDERQFLSTSRARQQAAPRDIDPAARLFYYFQQHGNLAAARHLLMEFKQRREEQKQAWTEDELQLLAGWLEMAGGTPEAAKLYYAEYAIGGSQAGRALASLTKLLLDYPDQPIRFGQGDLDLYRDVATMDPNPGFWNGILSLVFNGQGLDYRMTVQENKAVAYFHAAKAAELLALLDSRFSQSPARPVLHARLVDAYARHGASDAVLARGKIYLDTFKTAADRLAVSLRMAEAHAARNQIAAEFAIYDSLLAELAAKAGNRSLGDVVDGKQLLPRSPEYAHILDIYIARLVSMKRLPAAMALYRRELDRNPNDAALYERIAAFFEQNKLAADAESIFRRAMAQFPDRGWHHRLARFLIRQKQNAKVAELTSQVAKVFAGSELERYYEEAFRGSGLDAQLEK